MYGFNFSMKYKSFDFSFFIQGVQGNDVINGQKQMTDFWSVSDPGSNKGARLLGAWTPENPNSTIPALTLTDANNESRFSSYYVEKGTYMKLRNLQLGYNLPKSTLRKMKISSFRVYVGGDNLLLLMKSKSFTGVDPETPGYGYPNPRILTGGVSIAL